MQQLQKRLQQFQQHLQLLADIDEEAHEEEANLMEMFDDSDDETCGAEQLPILNRVPNKNRNATAGHEQMMTDYLNEDSVYSSLDFERRFRVTKGIFFRLCNDLQTKLSTNYFVQRRDCTGKLGLSTPQKVTAALRQLGYGVTANAVDEYVRIGETTARETLKIFASSVVSLYGPEYLRHPTAEDMRQILDKNAARGFPGCLGSLDCMHVGWKNCPTAWAGQYKGKEKGTTLVLKAVATRN